MYTARAQNTAELMKTFDPESSINDLFKTLQEEIENINKNLKSSYFSIFSFYSEYQKKEMDIKKAKIEGLRAIKREFRDINANNFDKKMDKIEKDHPNLKVGVFSRVHTLLVYWKIFLGNQPKDATKNLTKNSYQYKL